VLLNLGQLSVGIDQVNLKNIVNNLAFIGGIVFLFILGLFILMTIYPKQASKIIDWLINKILPQRIRQQVRNIANSFLEGLSSLHSFSSLFLLLLLTALIWTLETVLYWAVMKAMGLQLSFLTLMLLNGVINLVLLVPAAPGGLGTFDAACKTFLEAFGIATANTIAYSLQAILLLVLLNKAVTSPFRLGGSLLKSLLAAGVGGAAAYAVISWAPRLAGTLIGAVAAFGVGVILAALVLRKDLREIAEL